MKVNCNGLKALYVVIDDEYGDAADIAQVFPKTPLEFVGFALHAMQQGQARKLVANGNRISALTMDQTYGSIDANDIVRAQLKGCARVGYSRLKDLL
jgi:hypothetical protein